MIYKVVCSWLVQGSYDVEADSLEKAISKVQEAEQPYDGTPDNGEYVDDSFSVEAYPTREANKL